MRTYPVQNFFWYAVDQSSLDKASQPASPIADGITFANCACGLLARRQAAGVRFRDKTIRFWDAGSGAPLHTLKEHMNWVRAVAFSPDGKQLASASADNTVRLWDIGSGLPQ